MRKSFLTKVAHAMLGSPNEVRTTSNDEGDKAYADFLKRAERTVKIVCGECDPRLFEQKSIIGAIENLLVHNGKMELIVGTLDNEESAEEVRARLHRNNKLLSEVLSKYQNQAYVYVASKRPDLHYTIVDGKHVLFEEPHEPYKRRETRARFDDEKLAKAWEQRFDEYLQAKTDQKKLTAVQV